MTHPTLHIVTFAVPFPANYGGAIDVWNRLVALKSTGVVINLHCFVYASFSPSSALAEVADKVYYYPRVKWPAFFSRDIPYIVTSRKSKDLLKNLSNDHNPILFEGIHTTGFVKELEGRKLMLRAHNIEHQYYAELADQNKGVKSLIFRRESLCLRTYEHDLARNFDVVFAISPHDRKWFDEQGANTMYLPPFHGFETVDIQPGRGKYILYQGDLSIKINQEAVFDMLQRIPPEPGYPIIVAGKSGERSFEDKLADFPNLRREADVSHDKMIDLIRNAHVILVHSLHASGMKLKLFPALFQGRFVLASANNKTNTLLDNSIQFYQPDQAQMMVEKYWRQEFTVEMIKQRTALLGQQPTDREKAGEILRYL
jgi:hypothetical protein